MHHRMAEEGIITRKELQKIVAEYYEPPGAKRKKKNCFSTPTAHLHSHKNKIEVSFLEKEG